MPNEKLTARSVARLKAPALSGNDTYYWDTDTRGFGVKCFGKSNRKSYVVQHDIRLPSGKKRTRRVTLGAVNEISLDQARAEANDLIHTMRKGIDPKQRTFAPTLRWALDNYQAARKDHAEGTVRMYKEIERHCDDWMHLPLSEITGDMIEARHREIPKRIQRSNPSYKGEVTANFAMKTVGILYSFASKKHPNLPPNPIKRLERQWFKEPRRTRHVTPEQLPLFYRAVMALDNDICRDYILLMLFTGLRRDEVLKLKWKAEVDFIEKMIRLPAERTKPKRKLDLPMSDFVHRLLVARQSLGRAAGDFVFPGKGTSQRLTANIKSWKMIEALTSIKVSAHDMRRTFSSVAGETEMSPYALKAMLNHSNGGDVTAGYVIISSTALRAAVQKVADRLKMLCEIDEVTAANVARLR